jgi:hypothetical protein
VARAQPAAPASIVDEAVTELADQPSPSGAGSLPAADDAIDKPSIAVELPGAKSSSGLATYRSRSASAHDEALADEWAGKL